MLSDENIYLTSLLQFTSCISYDFF